MRSINQMKTQSEKNPFEEIRKRDSQSTSEPGQNLDAMEKSDDSIYKLLQQTPKNQDALNMQINSQGQANRIGGLFQQKLTQQHVKNLTYKFQIAISLNGQNQGIPKNKESITIMRAIKPSTPTYHAQSSLNFLKHRKKQILMNQAMGVTLNELHEMGKSRSKSKSHQKSQSNYSQLSGNSVQKGQSQPSFKYFKQKNDSGHLDSLKRHLRNKSISQLQKIQSVIGQFHNKNIKRKSNLIQNSTISAKSREIKCQSLQNSFRLSSATDKSTNYYENDLSKSRAQILGSITQKLTQSKVLKTMQIKKQEDSKRLQQNEYNKITQRLDHLVNFLKQFQMQKSTFNKQSDNSRIIQKTKFEEKGGFQMIDKLKKQIDSLGSELKNIKLIKKKKTQQKLQISQQKTYLGNVVFLKDALNTNLTSKKLQPNLNAVKNLSIQNRENSHLTIREPYLYKINDPNKTDISRLSPCRITFNYNTTQTEPIEKSFSNYKHMNSLPQNIIGDQTSSFAYNRQPVLFPGGVCHNYAQNKSIESNNKFYSGALDYQTSNMNMSNSQGYPVSNRNYHYHQNQIMTVNTQIPLNQQQSNFQSYNSGFQPIQNLPSRNKNSIQPRQFSTIKTKQGNLNLNNNNKYQ